MVSTGSTRIVLVVIVTVFIFCALRVIAAEIGVPIIPRFFLVTTQSGVKSMTFCLDGARERIQPATGHITLECVTAVWTYKYSNGYTITLRGPLTAHLMMTAVHPPGNNSNLNPPSNSDSSQGQYVYKFDELQFDANYHDKFIALESILGPRTLEIPPLTHTPMGIMAHSPSLQYSTAAEQSQSDLDDEIRWEEPRVLIEHGSIPGEPVNAFGIPQATMRCLELAESVTSMAELIQYAKETNSSGPLGTNSLSLPLCLH